MTCKVPTHQPCSDCSGEIIVGEFDIIRVPRLDEDGFPSFGPDGALLTVELPLPAHVAFIGEHTQKPMCVRCTHSEGADIHVNDEIRWHHAFENPVPV